MGSESNKRTGIERGSDTGTPYADQVEIIGVDISAEDLSALYVGTKREKWVCEVIRGLIQLQRTKRGTAAQWLIDAMRDNPANPPPIATCDLNLDRHGRNHVVVVAGRQRTMARRVEDAEIVAAGRPKSDRRQLTSTSVVFPATGTYAAVVNYRVVENVHDRRSFAARAEDVFDLRSSGRSAESLTREGEVSTVEEVHMLLALHECDDAVKDAVDAGKEALSMALVYVKLDTDEQRRRILRKLAGTNGKAKDAAAPARAKTRRADTLREAEEALRAAPKGDAHVWYDALDSEERAHYNVNRMGEAADVLAWAQGKTDMPEWLANAIEENMRRQIDSI